MNKDALKGAAALPVEELQYPLHLDEYAIQSLIPHRDEMLFPHQVTVLDANHFTGQVVWKAEAFVVKGHFPGRPIVPGVIIVEAGAQIAGVGMLAGNPKARARKHASIGLLAGIRKCFFKRPVPPGMLLTYDLHVRHVTDDVVNVTGEVSCVLGPVASLEFVFAQALHQGLLDNLQQVEEELRILQQPSAHHPHTTTVVSNP